MAVESWKQLEPGSLAAPRQHVVSAHVAAQDLVLEFVGDSNFASSRLCNTCSAGTYGDTGHA